MNAARMSLFTMLVATAAPARAYNTCVTPTLLQCRNGTYAGGACLYKNKIYCANRVTQDFQSQANETPQQTLLEPAGMPLAGTLTPMASQQYDQRGVTLQANSEFSYTAMREADIGFSVGDTITLDSDTSRALSRHAEYAQNGGVVSSCLEYVYEKYYDYSLFEDAIADCHRNYQCIANVALDSIGPNIYKELKKKNGTDMLQVRLPFYSTVEKPKNEFFQPDAMPALFAQWVKRQPNGTALMGPISNASSRAQPYSVGEPLEWHSMMHAIHLWLGISAPEYDDMAKRRANYAALIDQFRYLRAVVPPQTFLAILYPDSFSCAPQTVDGVQQPGGCPTTYDPNYAPGQLVALLSQIGEALANEWSHVDPATGAVDNGCLNPSGYGCDWSPREFVEAYGYRFQTERDKDFRRCFIDTGVIGQGPPPLTFNPNLGQPTQDDTDQLDAWMTQFEQGMNQAVAGLHLLYVNDPIDGTGIGDNKSGGRELGDPSLLALKYSYGAGWHADFGQVNGQLCNRDAAMYGDASITLETPDAVSDILDVSHDVLNLALVSYVGRSPDPTARWTGHMTVNGNQIVPQFTDQPATFVVPLATDSEKLAEYKQSLLAFGLPVDIDFKLQLEASVAMSMSGSASTCVPGNPNLALTTALTPTVGLNLSGSAAIGGGLDGFVSGDVGIDVNVDVVTLAMPLSANINVDPQQARFDLETNLALKSLDGSIDAYAEACLLGACVDAHKQIFHWPGLSKTIPLWTPLNQSVAVPDLAAFMREGMTIPSYGTADWETL